MHLLPLALLFIYFFSCVTPWTSDYQSLSLPPFRANYSAGSPSSVREAAGETAAALFRSYLPSSSSPSSIFLGLGGDGAEGAGVGDYQRRLRQRLLVLTLFVLPAVLPPFYSPWLAATSCTKSRRSMEVVRLHDRPKDRQRTDGRQTEET